MGSLRACFARNDGGGQNNGVRAGWVVLDGQDQGQLGLGPGLHCPVVAPWDMCSRPRIDSTLDLIAVSILLPLGDGGIEETFHEGGGEIGMSDRM